MNGVRISKKLPIDRICDKENFYSQLNAFVDKIPKGDIKILMGDFNAMVGSDNLGYEHIKGRHGLGEISENEELFAEFCGNNPSNKDG